MCTALAFAVVAGGAQAVGGIMQAKAQHNAAKRAAERQNQINELNFQNKLNIAAHKDKLKGQEFKKKMEAYAAAQSALARQQQLNVLESNRASIAAQQALKEKATEVSFESQENLVAKIQAQGSVLASGQQAGQSLLLTLMNEERTLGFKEAQLNARMHDARTSQGIQQYGINLDKYAADVAALQRLPSKPVTPSASFAPVKIPEVQGPSGLGLMGGIISAVGSGLSTGVSAGTDFHEAQGTWLKKEG